MSIDKSLQNIKEEREEIGDEKNKRKKCHANQFSSETNTYQIRREYLPFPKGFQKLQVYKNIQLFKRNKNQYNAIYQNQKLSSEDYTFHQNK